MGMGKFSMAVVVAAVFAMTPMVHADLFGLADDGESPANPVLTAIDGNITSGAFTRGSGLTQNAGGDLNSRDWTEGGDFATAQANGDFVSVTFDVDPGFFATVTTIDVFWDNSGTGPDQMQMTVNGVTVGSVFDPNNGNAFNFNVNTDYTGTVDIRFFGWGATSSSGTADIEDGEVGPGDVYGLFVDGTTQVIPEPATAGLLGLAAIALVGRRRRQA